MARRGNSRERRARVGRAIDRDARTIVAATVAGIVAGRAKSEIAFQAAQRRRVVHVVPGFEQRHRKV
jgi:hypothetical protein